MIRTIISGVIALGLATCLFAVTGNTHEPETYGPSLASWLVRQWLTPGSQSSHGAVIPLISLFFVWIRRTELRKERKRAAHGAVGAMVLLLVLYWAGVRTQQPRLGVLCMIGLTWTVPFYMWGWAVARHLVFPSAYLLFAVPLGFLSAMTLPLRIVSSTISAGLLNGIGLATRRVGTAIVSGSGEGFAMDVADPCSGLRSVIALTALTAAYACYTQKTLVRKWALFLCAVPLAMAGNIVRIVTIALVAAGFGVELALKVYHDYSGYIVFVSAILLMVALGALIHRWGEKWGALWNRPGSNNT